MDYISQIDLEENVSHVLLQIFMIISNVDPALLKIVNFVKVLLVTVSSVNLAISCKDKLVKLALLMSFIA